ncbi:MAG: prephenate dehydratase, partial [bacterium]|nr:prephenate dehydratase [bacterium]MDW8164203.1 prephenate dehydratase [Candidatus Omnitrophota bacterium]
YGVVPIENSIEGVVTHTLDVFIESDLKITSEIILEIHHFLLSKEKAISDIKKVYSHPQAIAQCRNWIGQNLPNAEIFETESTTSAVKKVIKEKNSAAIASEIAAEMYNLNILAERIEDFRENVTRFLVIGKDFTEKTGNDKTSILFSIKDKVGALHDILAPFKKENINLTRIESRPSKKKAWEYVFFVDFNGHKDEPNVKKALGKIKKSTIFLKILGSYPKEGG